MSRLLSAEYPAVMCFGVGGWGDLLLCLPALRALEALFPNRLTVVCQGLVREDIYNGLRPRAFCDIKVKAAAGRITFDYETLAEDLKGCDLLVSLNDGYDRTVAGFIETLSPVHSIGFFPTGDIKLPLDFSKHGAELRFDVPLVLDASLQLEDFATPVFATEHRDKALRITQIIPSEYRILAVHADTKPEKMWPASRFVTLLDLFLERHNDFIVLVVGDQNLNLDAGRHRDRIIVCESVPLPVAICLMGKVDYFRGVDSCMLHAADLFRTPGVSIFGPSSHKQFGFRFAPHRHVSGGCSMEAVEIDEVLDAVESLTATCKSRRLIEASSSCAVSPAF